MRGVEGAPDAGDVEVWVVERGLEGRKQVLRPLKHDGLPVAGARLQRSGDCTMLSESLSATTCLRTP